MSHMTDTHEHLEVLLLLQHGREAGVSDVDTKADVEVPHVCTQRRIDAYEHLVREPRLRQRQHLQPSQLPPRQLGHERHTPANFGLLPLPPPPAHLSAVGVTLTTRTLRRCSSVVPFLGSAPLWMWDWLTTLVEPSKER